MWFRSNFITMINGNFEWLDRCLALNYDVTDIRNEWTGFDGMQYKCRTALH